MSEIKDSGSRREYGTGAQRDRAIGKGRYDLLPFHAIRLLAKHFEAGAFKYGANNWRRGIPCSNYVDSALRHLHQFAAGERDEPHLVSALWNIACLIETRHLVQIGQIDAADVADIEYFEDDPYPAIFEKLKADDRQPVEESPKPEPGSLVEKFESLLQQLEFLDTEENEVPGEDDLPFGESLDGTSPPRNGQEQAFVGAEEADEDLPRPGALTLSNRLHVSRALWDHIQLTLPGVVTAIVAGFTAPGDQTRVTRYPVCYVAGPMRGYDQFNFPAFDRARDTLTRKGFAVISPADIDRAAGVTEDTDVDSPDSQRSFVLRDVLALWSLNAESGDAIALLPGWEKSTGALAELYVARWLGLRVLDATTGEALALVDLGNICKATHEFLIQNLEQANAK